MSANDPKQPKKPPESGHLALIGFPAFASATDPKPSDNVVLGSAYCGAHMTTRSGPSPSANHPFATI
jgi:hypothetical protein